AAAWAEVLGISTDRIGRRDHFFELGGTSLSALRLVIALERGVSLKDLHAHPTLADQATLTEHRGIRPTPARLPSAHGATCRPHNTTRGECTRRRNGRPTSRCACITSSATRSRPPATCCSRASSRPRREERPRWPTPRPFWKRCRPSLSSGSSGRDGS